MDDNEKSFFESITDTIKNTVDIATEAAKSALEPEPLKPNEEVVVVPTSEVVSADAMAPMSPMISVVKTKRRKKAPAKAAKTPQRVSKNKAAKKTVRKAAKKNKSAAKKKSTKKASAKKARKSTRRGVTKKKTKRG
jgi:hypothetical protein